MRARLSIDCPAGDTANKQYCLALVETSTANTYDGVAIKLSDGTISTVRITVNSANVIQTFAA